MGIFYKLDKPVFLREESDASDYIAKLTTLLPKVTGDTKEKIEREIKLASIGELGEKNIVFELTNSNMPMYVLRDIRLQHEDLSAQIDFIGVTRFFTYIVECKNLIGDIEIDSNGNFVRNYEYKGRKIKEGIYSPITQNQRHMDVLKRINRDSRGNVLIKMLSDKVFDSSYKSIVVLANPKTVLKAKYAKKEVKQQVIRADQLINYIKVINGQSKAAPSSDKDLKAHAEALLSRHSPNQADYTKKYEEFIEVAKAVEPIPVTAPETKQQAKQPEPETSQDNRTNSNISNNNNENEKLISDLKAFRLQRSREEQIKPYYI